LINNAYGIQSSLIMKQINNGFWNGRVDIWVSSTDKNFLVPVGGSVIYSNNKKLVK